jgi:membrane-bound lytic murein transglycosylase D
MRGFDRERAIKDEMRTTQSLRSTLYCFAWARCSRLALAAALVATPAFLCAAESSAQPELAAMSSVASAGASAPDPLGQLLRKLESARPVESAMIEPRSGDELVADVHAESIDLWERIRRGFKIPELTSPLVASSTRWYASRPDYIDRMSNRAGRYLYHIVQEIEKRGMPTELALLPFVESAMQPEALSAAKAAGLWQFIPSTGKLYQLEQNLWADERRDVLASTRAALDYLEKLYGDFGDWQLALAAYNCGEGCVGRAVARNARSRKAVNYSSLPLPRETQGYYPKLQAIKNIVLDPQAYSIALPEIKNEPYFVVLRKTRDIDVATAARLAEMPEEEFRSLNPSFNRPVIVAAGQARILLPADRLDRFMGNLAAYEATGQALSGWTTRVILPGETLAQVAEKAGISEAALREANRIPPRRHIVSGSAVLIPRDETMDDDISADQLNASFALIPEAPQTRRITYRVRRSDTLASVAARWHVNPQDILTWNRLQSRSLFAGQRVNLVVEATSKPARSTIVAQKRGGTVTKTTSPKVAQKSGKAKPASQAARGVTKTKAGKTIQVASRHGQ